MIGSKLFLIFTFDRVGWQTDKDLLTNSITMLILCVICMSSPTSDAQELEGFGLMGEVTKKHMDQQRSKKSVSTGSAFPW